MNVRHNIAVVGSGFAGLTSSIVLAQAGHVVTVFAPQKDEETSASKAAQGVSTMKGLLESSQELFALKMKGHEEFLDWLKFVEQISCRPVAKIWGVHELFDSKDEYGENQRRIYKRRFLGAFCRTESEVLGQGSFAANFYPRDFWVDTSEYLQALQAASLNLGVHFAEYGLIHSISETADGVCVTSLTPENNLQKSKKFDFVVLSAGAGTAKIQGLKKEDSESLWGVGGTSYKGKHPAEGDVPASVCFVKKTNTAAFFAGKIHLGSSSESAIHLATTKDGDPYPKTSRQDPSKSSSAEKIYSEFVREAAHTPVSWTPVWGVRVRGLTRAPTVSWARGSRRMILNVGYYKSGMTLSPLGAKKIAEMLLSGSLI